MKGFQQGKLREGDTWSGWQGLRWWGGEGQSGVGLWPSEDPRLGNVGACHGWGAVGEPLRVLSKEDVRRLLEWSR